MAYTDAFGMKVTYGRDEAVDENGLVDVTHFGAVHQITQLIDFDAYGVPSTTDLTIRSAKIPAGSAVLDCKLVVLSAAATAATTVDVGTVELDGTAIDEDGLLDGVALSAGVKTPIQVILVKCVGKSYGGPIHDRYWICVDDENDKRVGISLNSISGLGQRESSIFPLEDSTILYALHSFSRYASRKVKTVEDLELEYEEDILE